MAESLRLTITPADVKRNKIVQGGWYQSKVVEVSIEKNKKDPSSNNAVVEVEGIEGASEGARAMSWFPEKYPSMAQTFVEACTGTKISEETGGDFVFGPNLKGKTILALWEPGEYNGRKTNNIRDWAPVADLAAAAAASANVPGADF
jgi:hypothetical protein